MILHPTNQAILNQLKKEGVEFKDHTLINYHLFESRGWVAGDIEGYIYEPLKSEALDEKMNELMEKYCNLVWYARSQPIADLKHWNKGDFPLDLVAGAGAAQRRIEEKYSSEVKELCGDESDWTHGFNSGALAMVRLIVGLKNYDADQALEDFPELDS